MEFETIPTPLDLSTKEKKEATVLTDESFADLSFIRLGSGAKSIILDIQTGMYVGSEQFTSAPFSVDFDGKVIASNIEITGGSVSGVSLSGLASGTDINIFGWTSTMTFSATDYRTVTWTSGVITLADGTTFNIGTGNTGNMSALTYIYFDKSVSTTALQVTTTAATAVGANKILIAVAQNNSDTASKATLQVFGGKGGQLITVDQIAANSASVNEFISNTAQIKDAVITSAKIASLNADKINVGTLTGFTIQTDTSGYRTVLTSANGISFYNGSTKTGYIKSDTASSMIIQTADNFYYLIGTTWYSQLDSNGWNLKSGLSYAFQSGRKLTDASSSIQCNGSFTSNADRQDTCGTDAKEWNHVYTWQLHCSNNAWADNWYTNSDIKVKKNVKQLTSALGKLLQIRGVEFDYKKDNKHSVGVIAQEVEQVFPEFVAEERRVIDDGEQEEYEENGLKRTRTKNKKFDTIKTVDYTKLVPVMIEAIREQQETINKLSAKKN